MLIHAAKRLMREACALRHLSLNTEKTYTHWLVRYAAFLKDPKLKSLTTELKIEAFLTKLALSGVSASTQNQAFNSLLFFYRSGIKQELGPVDSLRAKRHETLRPCPDRQDVPQLLATVSDIYRYPLASLFTCSKALVSLRGAFGAMGLAVSFAHPVPRSAQWQNREMALSRVQRLTGRQIGCTALWSGWAYATLFAPKTGSNRRSAVGTWDEKGSPHKHDAFHVSSPGQALILLNDSEIGFSA